MFVISDNVPFNSVACKKFANEWNFQFIFSSPRYPKSNGLAERGVQTAKQILKKCFDEGKDVQLALMDYRNLPIYNLGLSPSQLLLSRRMRTRLPISKNLLVPEINGNVKDRLESIQKKSKTNYDYRSKYRKPFERNENVVIRDGKVWKPAVIIDKHVMPRSYIVKKDNGNVVRRN